MSKKRRIVLFISALVMIICMQVSVHAASNSNPLKNMPTESVSIAGAATGEGCNFFTPQYKSNFKMKATSSNKKVATVKVYDFQGTDGYSKAKQIWVNTFSISTFNSHIKKIRELGINVVTFDETIDNTKMPYETIPNFSMLDNAEIEFMKRNKYKF